MNIINLTPHAIVLNNGKEFVPSGTVARVTSELTVANVIDGIAIYSQTFGDITGLAEPNPDTIYIVSALVLAASDRDDLVAPATGHKDVIRNESGQIVSVPGFVRRIK